MRQHVMLAGRGSSSVGGRARWRVGLATAPSGSPGAAADDEGGGGGGAEDAGPRPSLPQVASIERASQKVEFVAGAVERHIEDLEDAYLADRVMARVERGEEGVKSLEALERELGLAD